MKTPRLIEVKTSQRLLRHDVYLVSLNYKSKVYPEHK